MADTNKGIINYGSIGGDASVRHQEIVRGDRISIQGQGTAGAPEIEAKLAEMLEELKTLLAGLLPAHRDTVEALQQQCTSALAVAKSDKPNPVLLKTSCSALKQIGETLGDVAPVVPVLVKGVAAAIAALAGVL